jgi:hypothetical protein
LSLGSCFVGRGPDKVGIFDFSRDIKASTIED